MGEAPNSTLVLSQLAEDLWEQRQSLRLFGLALGCRMTVLRLPSGKLWIHSPVALNSQLISQLDERGEVGYIVAPNRLHHLHLSAMHDLYPKAETWASPGLAKKRPDFEFTGLLSDDARPSWHSEIEHKHLLGMPLVDEVAFFARKSRALILTDCVFNLGHATPPLTRFLMRLVGGFDACRPTLELKLLIRDKKQFRAGIEAILQWPFEMIIMSHGEIVRDKARERLHQGYSWLLS